MDSEIFANLSWREGLIAIVALLAIYLVIAFLRYRKLQRERNAADPQLSFANRSAVAAYEAVREPSTPAAPTEMTAAATPPFAAPGGAADFAWNEPPAVTPEQGLLATLERELAQLRKEVGGLRAEVLLLREAQQRDVTKTQVAEKVSPIYSDAMQMAMQGQEAAAISLHCGISRAEAELVVAHVRNRDS